MDRYKQAAGWLSLLLAIETPLWHEALVNTSARGPWAGLAAAVVVISVTTVGANGLWFALSLAARVAKPAAHLPLAVGSSLLGAQVVAAWAFSRWPDQIGANLATEVIGALIGGVVVALVFALVMSQHEDHRDQERWLDVETMVVTAIDRSLKRISRSVRVLSDDPISYNDVAVQPLGEQVDSALALVRDRFEAIDEQAAEHIVEIACESVDIWPHLVLGPVAGVRRDPLLFKLALQMYDGAQQLRQYRDLRGQPAGYDRRLARDHLIGLLLTAGSLADVLPGSARASGPLGSER
jgi:hypothetical protein